VVNVRHCKVVVCRQERCEHCEHCTACPECVQEGHTAVHICGMDKHAAIRLCCNTAMS
jgi:hypothetical protein